MRVNTTKAKLAEGKVVIGGIVSGFSPEIVELLALLRFDFVFLDCEHGSMNEDQVEHMVRAAESFGITPIARIPNHEDSTILRYLDRGVQGLIIPHINTAEAAREVVAASRYHPHGHRGSASGRAHDYGVNLPRPESMAFINDNVLVIPMCEEVEAVQNLDSILAVPGIDVVHVASGDLGQSMGHPLAAEVRAVDIDPLAVAACRRNAALNGLRVDVSGEDLVGLPVEGVDVLLAQAQLARTGPSWRDAIPFFDQVLALEPGNVPALLGRVELANEAGLKRTALATLAKAVEASPSSIALLRVYAAALRQLDRSSEAAEAEERYASLRFDDATYLADRIDLALARRDAPAAERWIDRLLASEPDSAFALGSVARAYRALGQPGRALAAWEHALALAPEDVDVLRQLADLHAAAGRPEAQLALLRKILELRPQAKEVREYVDHVEPPRARKDETWAWEPDRFLARRDAAAAGHTRRTLRDLHVTTVFANGLASRFHQIVFQPLTDEAAAAAREYAFGYQADSETVQLRAAKVYRKDGKVDEAIESGESPADDPALATYTSARTFYVHFPRLGAGDVVELRYRIDDVTPRNDFADAFGEIAYLQSTEPVLSSEYVLRAPKGRRFTLFVSPLEGVTREERDEDDLHVIDVRAQDVPPIAVEPSMAPLTEVLAHVHAETWGSWDDVARFYAGLSKDAFVADDEVRARVAKLTAGLDDPAAKVRAVYGWVVQRTRYVALEFGIYGFKPRRAAQTLARGWGDCKDKATLIVTMLREAGIDAQIVLVRTGMRGGFETAPPGLAPFDHAIAYVPSLDLFLDGTAEYTGSTELPSMDRGALALVVDAAGTGKLVHLPDPPADATRRTRRVEATLAPDGSAQVELHLQTTGAHASEWRQRYHSPATRRERVAEDLAGDIPGFALAPGASAVDMNDLEDIEQAPRLRALGRVTAFARREGADLSIPVGPGERLVPAYAALSQRARDVRLRQRSTVEDELVLKLPAGVDVKSAPAPARLETPFGTATLEVERAGGKVTVKTKLVLSVSRIAAADYPAWRAFCEDVDRTFAQRLVVGGAK